MAQTMYRLMQAVDYSKLKLSTKLKVGESVFTIKNLVSSNTAELVFTQTRIINGGLRTIQYTCGADRNYCMTIDSNGYRDISSTSATSDIYLYY